MRITKRQLKRIIKEEVSRAISESSGPAYDRLYAKYDEISDMHSMTDGANALADDLVNAGLWEKIPGYEQDLDWDEQLDWISDNQPGWLDTLAATLPRKKKGKKKGRKSISTPTWFKGSWWDSGRGKADVDQYQTDLATARQFDFHLHKAFKGRQDNRYQDVLERHGASGILRYVLKAIEYTMSTEGHGGSFSKDLPENPPEPTQVGVLKIILAMAEAVSSSPGPHGTRWTGEYYFYEPPASDEEARALSEIIKILTDTLG